MVEENSPNVGNVLVNRNIGAGQTIHIPQGLQHFSHNPTCQGAQFLVGWESGSCFQVTSAVWLVTWCSSQMPADAAAFPYAGQLCHS